MKCFECGESSDVQRHHVIPKSQGGKNTLPLCSLCHKKIHGIGNETGGLVVSHSELTKRGRDKLFLFEYLIIARLTVKGRGSVDYTYRVIKRILRMNNINHHYSKAMNKRRTERIKHLFLTDREYANYLLFDMDGAS